MIEPPLPSGSYEPKRLQALKDMQAYKQGRRMQIADDLSLLWESHRTVQHQVQEMARMEGEDEDALAAIFKEYEELEPREGRLTASLFVEVQDASHIKPRLRHYAGIERAIHLDGPHGRIDAEVLGDSGDDEAATAVTYLAFPGTPTPETEIVVEHAHLAVRMPLPDHVVDEPV